MTLTSTDYHDDFMKIDVYTSRCDISRQCFTEQRTKLAKARQPRQITDFFHPYFS